MPPIVLVSIRGSSSEQSSGRFPHGASVSQSWRDNYGAGTHRKGLAHSRHSQNESCLGCMAHFLNLKHILGKKERKGLEVLIGTMAVARG